MREGLRSRARTLFGMLGRRGAAGVDEEIQMCVSVRETEKGVSLAVSQRS
jgi:hypothetical protein